MVFDRLLILRLTINALHGSKVYDCLADGDLAVSPRGSEKALVQSTKRRKVQLGLPCRPTKTLVPFELSTFTPLFYHFFGEPTSWRACGKRAISHIRPRGRNRSTDANQYPAVPKTPPRGIQPAQKAEKRKSMPPKRRISAETWRIYVLNSPAWIGKIR